MKLQIPKRITFIVKSSPRNFSAYLLNRRWIETHCLRFFRPATRESYRLPSAYVRCDYVFTPRLSIQRGIGSNFQNSNIGNLIAPIRVDSVYRRGLTTFKQCFDNSSIFVTPSVKLGLGKAKSNIFVTCMLWVFRFRRALVDITPTTYFEVFDSVSCPRWAGVTFA